MSGEKGELYEPKPSLISGQAFNLHCLTAKGMCLASITL